MRSLSILIAFIFLFSYCSDSEEQIVEQESIDIKRVVIDTSPCIAQFIYDNTNIDGLQRNDVLTTDIKARARMTARLNLFEQDGNELKSLQTEFERYSNRYQIFI